MNSKGSEKQTKENGKSSSNASSPKNPHQSAAGQILWDRLGTLSNSLGQQANKNQNSDANALKRSGGNVFALGGPRSLAPAKPAIAFPTPDRNYTSNVAKKQKFDWDNLFGNVLMRKRPEINSSTAAQSSVTSSSPAPTSSPTTAQSSASQDFGTLPFPSKSSSKMKTVKKLLAEAEAKAKAAKASKEADIKKPLMKNGVSSIDESIRSVIDPEFQPSPTLQQSSTPATEPPLKTVKQVLLDAMGLKEEPKTKVSAWSSESAKAPKRN